MSNILIADGPERVLEKLDQVSRINHSSVEIEAHRALELGSDFALDLAVERMVLSAIETNRKRRTGTKVEVKDGGRLMMSPVAFDSTSGESFDDLYPEVPGPGVAVHPIFKGRLPFDLCCEVN